MILYVGRALVKEQNKLKILIGHGASFRDNRILKYGGKRLTRTFTLYLHW